MTYQKNKIILSPNYRPAVALVVTLVVLVALSTVAYGLYARLMAQRHRDQYIIDYTAARYAADSGLKYGLTITEIIKPTLIPRPNEPDFSDLFRLSEEEYEQLITEWAKILEKMIPLNEVNDVNEITDVNEPNEIPYVDTLKISDGRLDPNSITIRGPYGPAWPLITDKIELQIGPADVTIEIHDENAKMPISWAIVTDKEINRETEAAFETFCEWMQMDPLEIKELKAQTKEIAEIKNFQFLTTSNTTTTTSRPASGGSGRNSKPTKLTPQPQVSPHIIDWVRLFHSPLLDTETLAKPIIKSEKRQESALKYLCLWVSDRVNINTAPRHVLEAAFTFGGDADKIAEEIIQKRRFRPFINIRDLQNSLFNYSDSISKADRYITTNSNLFTIRVTARSGVAKVSAFAAVNKTNEKTTKIAVIAE